MIIIARLLEFADLSEIRWLFRRYSRREIKIFVLNDGQRLLSDRSFNFWKLYFKLPAKRDKKVKDDPWKNR